MSKPTKPDETSLNLPDPELDSSGSREGEQAAEPKKYKYPVYFKKDVKKRCPLDPSVLTGVVVYQYRERQIEGTTVEVPAANLNTIGVYTPEEYERHAAEGGLFERLGIKTDVWHRPEETDTVQDQ